MATGWLSQDDRQNLLLLFDISVYINKYNSQYSQVVPKIFYIFTKLPVKVPTEI